MFSFVVEVCRLKSYFLLLCLFLRNLFLRLCVDILCLFFFFPLGIALKILWVNTIVYYLRRKRRRIHLCEPFSLLSGRIIPLQRW
jgi:hypothetical protein